MNVSQVIETEQGKVTFKGELSGQELGVVVEAGLNVLLAQGSLPFLSTEKRDISTLHQGTEKPQ